MAELAVIWRTLQGMAQDLVKRLPYLFVSAVVFAAFYFGAKLLRMGVYQLSRRTRRGRNVALVFGRLSQVVLVLIGLLVALTILLPSFHAADLIQLLGIGGVAISFAFRDILQNFLAGILILLIEPFQIGDEIVFGEFEGSVEEIQTRATLIRTYDGRRVIVPNSSLFTSPVIVNTAFSIRRIQYDVGIGVGDDIDRAKAIILAALQEVEDVLPAPAPEVLVVDLADFSVKLRIWFWINPPKRIELLHTRDRVLARIKTRLIDNGIDLPFPTQQVLFHDQTEETDGDRRRQREGWPAGSGPVPKRRHSGVSAEPSRPAGSEESAVNKLSTSSFGMAGREPGSAAPGQAR